MKAKRFVWSIFLILLILVVQLLGCQKENLAGIEVIKNPGSIGLEEAIWSPFDLNEFLITASDSGFLGESEVFLFDLRDYSMQQISYTSRGDIYALGWSPDSGKIILTANEDTKGYEKGGLWLWDKGVGSMMNVICCKGIDAATFINQNQIIFSPVIGVKKGYADLILLDVDNRNETKIPIDLGAGHIYSLSFSSARNEIIFALWEEGSSSINILEIDNYAVSRVLAGRKKIDHPTWSPSGEMIAFTEPSPDGILTKIIDLDTECEKEIPKTFQGIFSLSWSPDGQKIAVVSSDEIFILDLVKIFNTNAFNVSFLCD